jgi:O-antigen/teichoic acid export membrane protein
MQSRQAGAAVFANTNWLIFDKLIRMALGLALSVWLARYLGPDGFGLLSYAIAFVALFGSVAGLGLDGIAVRELVRHPADEPAILGSAFALKLGGAALAGLSAVVSLHFLGPEPGLPAMVGLLSAALLFQAFDVIDFAFQAVVGSRATVAARLVSFLLSSALRAALILAGAKALAFAGANLVEGALGAVALAVAYSQAGRRLVAWHATASRALQLMRDSWPLIFSSLVIMLYMRIDQVMLGQMQGSRAVGIYSVAVRLSEAWYLIPTAIVASWYPSVVEALERKDEALYLERLQRLYNLMAFLAYAAALPALFLARPAVTLLFGEGYAEAAPMLVVLLFAGMFINLGVARSAFLTSMNWTKTHFLTVLLGAVANVLLNLWLIPRYGGMGASLASLASYWLAAHGACFLTPRLRPTGLMMGRAILLPRVW